MTISVIIPVLNEEDNIAECIANVRAGVNVEVIVVDGGSSDRTTEIAKNLEVTLLSAPPHRGQQLNTGAKAASGEILLFLHADTRLPPDFTTMVQTALSQPQTVAGAFNLQIDGKLLALRWVEMGVRMRSHYLKLPYGDQAIFIKTSVFQQLGGFPHLPIMEDLEMMRQLRQLGKISIVPTPVITSTRRWQQQGICYTTLTNQILIIAYLLGISPTKIAHYYRRQPRIRC